MTRVCLMGAVSMMAVAGSAFGSLIAADNAAQTAYNSGFNTGANGFVSGFGGSSGNGWGSAWTISLTNPGNSGQNGTFVASSTGNGDGLDDGKDSSGGAITGAANDGDINTAGRAWGLYANSGQTVSAVRSFSGAFELQQRFRLDMDTGYQQTGATVGFGLRNSSGQNLFELYFIGGQTNYTVNATGLSGSLPSYTTEGMSIEFYLVTPTTFSVTLTRRDGVAGTVTGTLLSAAGGSGIEQVRLFNFNGGSGNANNAYFNSVSIPTPGAGALMGLGGLMLARRRR